MTNVKCEYVHFGKSLVHELANEEEHKDVVFSEGGRIHGEYWAMEIGYDQDSVYWPRLSAQCMEGPQHTKAAMIRMGDYKYVMRLYEKDEFYNLKEDPKEQNNCIDETRYQGDIAKIRNRLLQ